MSQYYKLLYVILGVKSIFDEVPYGSKFQWSQIFVILPDFCDAVVFHDFKVSSPVL